MSGIAAFQPHRPAEKTRLYSCKNLRNCPQYRESGRQRTTALRIRAYRFLFLGPDQAQREQTMEHSIRDVAVKGGSLTYTRPIIGSEEEI